MPQAMYRLTDIGDFANVEAYALGAAGQVTGFANFPAGAHALSPKPWKSGRY